MANDTFTIYDESQPMEAKQFCKDFLNTEVGKRFLDLYDDSNTAQAAWDGVIAKFRKVYGNDPIVFGDLQTFVGDLLLSGGLRAPEPVAPQPKQLSSSQLAWQEYRVFSEQNDMRACRARAASDPGYASFMHKNLEREAAEQSPTDLINLNANRTPTKRAIPSDVAAYAERYRTLSIDAVRKELSPGMNPLGPAAAAEAQRLFDASCAAGLI
jgi:hypothetical protein